MHVTFSDIRIWFALLGIVTAFIVSVRGLRTVAKDLFVRSLMPLLCLLGVLLLFIQNVPRAVINGTAVALIGIVTSIVFSDIVREFFLRIKSSLFSQDYFMKALPVYAQEICRALELLTQRHTGGLVVIERMHAVREHLGASTPFNADIKADVLVALFATTSPLHDGAVVVKNGRICRVKAVLPLCTKDNVPLGIGTRHRSAIGITEKTDAIALVASEERGELSIAFRGTLIKGCSPKELPKLLHGALKGKMTQAAARQAAKKNV
ncbi:MAG: DNA integrity scanning protein DisA nucleotide-binding domain protein [Candidatus Omnitrophica bacterium]|nr:DNA integrity scanning protein DisA nucleotide-binding domain protein [Candidatus Omnitrophota bacterium]